MSFELMFLREQQILGISRNLVGEIDAWHLVLVHIFKPPTVCEIVFSVEMACSSQSLFEAFSILGKITYTEG